MNKENTGGGDEHDLERKDPNENDDDQAPAHDLTVEGAPPALPTLTDGEQTNPVPGASGTQLVNKTLPKPPSTPITQKRNNSVPTRKGSLPDQSAAETADDTETEDKRKSRTRKSTAGKNPPLHAQLSALLERLDKQAERTDELLKCMKPADPATQRPTTTSRRAPTRSPPPSQQHAKRPIHGSHYKRRSPKSGSVVSRHTSRAAQKQRSRLSSTTSSSSQSDYEGQVRKAMEMLEPRFTRQKGKPVTKEDKVMKYRPFAYLERELQRDIIKTGHPEELTVTQHLSGLCSMALEDCGDQSDAYGIVNHILQILEDQSYMLWPNVRAFSNTVIAQIARGRWYWSDDRLIERCRTNMYMRNRQFEDTTWSVPCPKYNKGRCPETDSHPVGIVTMRHICSYCSINGYENAHTLRACKWRKGTSGGAQQRKNSPDDRRERYGKSSAAHRADTHDNAKN